MGPVTLLMIFIASLAYFILKRLESNKGKHATMTTAIPGPTGLGCLKAFISSSRESNLHNLAYEWAKRYGDLVQIRLLSQNIVFVNDAKLVRRLFNSPSLKDLTNDRPKTFIGKFIVYGEKGVAFTSRTPQQILRRKIFHGVLKFYGDNVQRFEDIFVKSLHKLTRHIQNKTAVDLSTEMAKATLRIVDTLMTGETSNSKERIAALERFDSSFSQLFIFDIETVLQAFPALRFLPGTSIKCKYNNLIRDRNALIDVYFDRLKETHFQGEEKGLIDHLLTAQCTFQEKGDNTVLADDSVKALICETTIASYLTTSRTMSTLFLLLITNPGAQVKLHAEVREVMGEQVPSLRHRCSMPYTEATILEVLRYSSSGPFLLPHYCRDDVFIDDYKIPKGTVLLANGWYCHRREDQWEDPWGFHPERFLDDNGQLLQADHPTRQNMILFGTGCRSCPGEAFARSRMFLIVTTLIQHFEFYALPGEPLPTTDPRLWKPCASLSPEGYVCGIRKI